LLRTQAIDIQVIATSGWLCSPIPAIILSILKRVTGLHPDQGHTGIEHQHPALAVTIALNCGDRPPLMRCLASALRQQFTNVPWLIT
jgi:hypothetical protein